ncbi:MAG: [citrate (pro-3S)-lyase] ligase [Spirochaetales bacterium]|nr:[citrate (pro-3S)-lyase] ligase [Spirochaetales bacterium]
MAWSEDFSIRSLSPGVASERAQVETFLRHYDLQYETDIEYTVGVFRGEAMVATGSLAGRVIKGVAVSEAGRGHNLTAKVVSYLKLKAHHQGLHSLFLFTSPENRAVFTSLGFTPLAETSDALLFEDNKHGLRRYRERLAAARRDGADTAALVMNCNPFTNGHRYLIETVSRRTEHVVLFVVEEDRSVFPFDDRLALVADGTADLPNVCVVPGGDYIISGATFPTYFIKDTGRINAAHAKLDATLFGRSIAPAVGATRRFVGAEPYCEVTAHYNRVLAEVLPPLGVEVTEIERKETGGRAISASEVRRLWAHDALTEVAAMVPESTYRFLVSEAAAPIKCRLQGDMNEDR